MCGRWLAVPSIFLVLAGNMSRLPTDPNSQNDPERNDMDFRSQGEGETRPAPKSRDVAPLDYSLEAFQKVLPERYQIVREIGSGGMGQVLLAIDRGPALNDQEYVAIKRMLGPTMGDTASVARFLQELKLARTLRHPNVVQMYHCDNTPLGPYIVMEYIEGVDLGEYIRRYGPLKEGQARTCFRKLASALHEGHKQNIIHRDLKPRNILISKAGQPYLVDFGIARRLSDADKTGTGLGAGTIAYMSPEQLENRTPDIRQDIYGLGATLFHAVEGRPPFEADSVPRLISKVMSEPPPRAKNVSPQFADRIAQCLQKDASQRPASCEAFMIGISRREDGSLPPATKPTEVTVPPAKDASGVGTPPILVTPSSKSSVASSAKAEKKRRLFLLASGIGVLGLLGFVVLAISLPWNPPSDEPPIVHKPSPEQEKERQATAIAENSKPNQAPASDDSTPKKAEEPKLETQLTNDLGMQFRLIDPGEFTMGSEDTPEELVTLYPDANPSLIDDPAERHQVRLTNAYYMGTHEVTVGQFRKFVEETGYKTEAETDGKGGGGVNAQGEVEESVIYTWRNPGYEQGDTHPVGNVSWNDAKAFVDWLSLKEKQRYRLPTEAEWEYACRAGSKTRFSFGNDDSKLGEYGWFSEKGDLGTHPIGQKKPNAWGLYDMHGNVWEWCHDIYQDYSGKNEAEMRIFRALNDRGEVAFTSTPLVTVMQTFSDQYAIPILIDWVGLDESGVTPDEPITLNVADISLNSALKLIVDPLDLTYVIEDEVLKITAKRDTEEIEQVKTNPTGAFSELDLKRNGSQWNDKELRIVRALSERGRVDFVEEPLSRVLASLADTHSIPIVIDERAVEEEGAMLDAPETLNVDLISLRAALNIILQPHNLTFVIENEVLKITNENGAATSEDIANRHIPRDQDISRVFRGGSWKQGAVYCRNAHRARLDPSVRDSSFGFRIVLIPSGSSASDPVRSDEHKSGNVGGMM
jgi:eukaryotic-like serine/threonine-protein kinase